MALPAPTLPLQLLPAPAQGCGGIAAAGLTLLTELLLLAVYAPAACTAAAAPAVSEGDKRGTGAHAEVVGGSSTAAAAGRWRACTGAPSSGIGVD